MLLSQMTLLKTVDLYLYGTLSEYIQPSSFMSHNQQVPKF